MRAVLLLGSAAAAAATLPPPLSLVDPFIGSGGLGFGAGSHNPGAQIPFGSFRLGPDTGLRVAGTTVVQPSFDHFGGYAHADNAVIAFSHTHLVGAGVGDLGNFGVMPVRLAHATTDANLSRILATPSGHAAVLDHAAETAAPGFYAVRFAPPLDANVSLTATGSHNGTHLYEFRSDPTGMCGVLVDVCHTAMGDGAAACKDARVSVSPAPTPNSVLVTASLRMAGALTKRAPGGGVPLFFAARVHVPAGMVPATRLWASGSVLPKGVGNASHRNGSLGAWVETPCASADAPATSTTIMRVDTAISFIDAQHALANLGDVNVAAAALRDHANALWLDRLRAVNVSETKNEPDLVVKFYTALYHANVAPSIYDENGEFRSFGDTGRNAPAARLQRVDPEQGHALTDLSLWDIHRTQLPWLSLTAPSVFADVLLSLQRMMQQGSGDVPRWPLLNIYTGCMIGSHAFVTFAETVRKQQTTALAPLNLTAIYDSMRRTATTPRPQAGRPCVSNYSTLGYVPDGCASHAASLTLSYAFDDDAVATVAAALGKHDDAAYFRNRSRQAYRLLWDAPRQLLCPRAASGELKCPLVPALAYPFEETYTEGDGLQWLWFVPHDPEGLAQLFPDPDAFVDKLHRFFLDARPVSQGGKWAAGTFLANAWYWAGNEPDILAPWLFSFARGAAGSGGKSWQYANYTQFWTRWLVDHAYNTRADGLPGNDDFGTLSSWLLWAGLGLYPQAGTDRFILGSPMFASARVRTGPGAVLCIVAHGKGPFVDRVEANGKALDAPFVDFATIQGSGQPLQDGCSARLEFWMQGKH